MDIRTVLTVNLNRVKLNSQRIIRLIRSHAETFRVVLARLIATFSTFLLIYALSQRGAELAGEFLWIYSLIFLISAFIRGGLELSVLKQTSQSFPSRHITQDLVKKSALITSLYLCILASLALLMLYGSNLFIDSIELIGSTAIYKNAWQIFLCILFFSLLTILSASLQGALKVGSALTLLTTIPNTLFITMTYLFESNTTENLSYLYAASLFIGLIISLAYWSFTLPGQKDEIEGSHVVNIRSLINTSMPFWIIICLNQYTLNLASVLGFILHPEEITVFLVAFKLSLLISFVYMAVNNLLIPKFTNLWFSGKTVEAKILVGNCTVIMLIFGVPIFMAVFVFASLILEFFGVYNSIEGIIVVRIMAVTQLGIVLTGSVEQMLNMSGYAKQVRNVLFASCIAGSAILYIFSLYFGVVGAAIGVSMLLISYNVSLALKANSLLGINILHFRKYSRMAI